MGKITLKRQRNDSRSTALSNKRSSGVMSPIIPSNVDELALDSEIDFFFSESNTNIHSVLSTFKVPAVPRKLSVVEEDTVDSGIGSVDALSSDLSSHRFDSSPRDSHHFLDDELCQDPNTVLLHLLNESENDDSLLTDEPLSKMPRMSLMDMSKVTNIDNSVTGLDSIESVWSSDFCNSSKAMNGTGTMMETLTSVTTERNPLSLSIQKTNEEMSKSENTTLEDKKDPSAELANLQAVLRSFIRDGADQKSGLDAEMLVDSERTVPTKSEKLVNGAGKIASKAVSSLLKPVSDKSETLNNLLATRGTKRIGSKGLTLWSALSSRSRDNLIELKILSQPEEQHRARYLTEGSRGAVKDRSGSGFPTVKLCGYSAPATLQVFIGTDQGKVQPHLFYQASKVCGKNSTPCTQRKIDGTTVLEISLTPDKDMTASCDCVGILKERNVDVEHRLTHFGGTKAGKKRSTRCRIVFRVTVSSATGVTETLQVASDPILCTQPPGIPEICKKSLTETSVDGGEELFIIGKNFLKDTKVIFREIHQDQESTKIVWEKCVEPDREYLHPTHLICRVPPYKSREVSRHISVQLLVDSGGKNSEPHCFTYKPLQIVQDNKTVESIMKSMVPSISSQSADMSTKGSVLSTMVPVSTNIPSSLDVPVPQSQPNANQLVSAAVLIPTTTAFMSPNPVHIPGSTSITIISGQLDGCSVTQSERANLSSEEMLPPRSSPNNVVPVMPHPSVKQESMNQLLGDLDTLIEASNHSEQQRAIRKEMSAEPRLPCPPSVTGNPMMGYSLPTPDFARNGPTSSATCLPEVNGHLFATNQWPDRNYQFMENMVQDPLRGTTLKIKQDRTAEEAMCMATSVDDQSMHCFLPRLQSNMSSLNMSELNGASEGFSSGPRINNPPEYTCLSDYIHEYEGLLSKSAERGLEHPLLSNGP